MKTCHYHPLSAATYYCSPCQKASCDDCSNALTHHQAYCFHCEEELQSLGAAHTAEPFWRRIDSSFKYALKPEPMIFLAILALLSSLANYLPLSLLFQLIFSGVLIKYCFGCLAESSQGNFNPPDIIKSYQGGLETLAKLLIVVFGILGMCVGTTILLGKSLGLLISVCLISALPAAIIILALSDSVLDAINPLKLLDLIRAIGLPYGLILGFIMIMSSSVLIISNLFGDSFSLINMILQEFVSNFYMVVMFHILGYMIFQYQGKLDFVAREDDDGFQQKSALEKCKSQLSMTLKDGEFTQLIHDYVTAIKQFPKETELADQCFNLLYATHNTEFMDEFGSFYFESLIQQKKSYQLKADYKRLIAIHPTFKADNAKTRHELAKVCFDAGDHKAVVKLLASLHKNFPDYPELPEAYHCLAQSLNELPGQQENAKKFFKVSEKFTLQREQKLKAPSSASNEKSIIPKPSV